MLFLGFCANLTSETKREHVKKTVPTRGLQNLYYSNSTRSCGSPHLSATAGHFGVSASVPVSHTHTHCQTVPSRSTLLSTLLDPSHYQCARKGRTQTSSCVCERIRRDRQAATNGQTNNQTLPKICTRDYICSVGLTSPVRTSLMRDHRNISAS